MPIAAQLESDTIVAVATPPGRGGIGVVRLSGPASLSIGRSIVALRTSPVSHRAHYGTVVDESDRTIDDAVFTWYAAPHSYTAEDVVEISTHGSPVVQHAVVAMALRHGARLARPGEFTERAFLHGRLDLSAAEAVRDLIDAQTRAQAHLAAQQLGGSLAREVTPIKHALVQLIAALEAGIDFAEDDLDTLPTEVLGSRIELLLHPLERLEGSFARTRLLREGVKLAIVGEPNTGKSSLFNRLLGSDRAFVTAVAGTTRDTVTESLVLCSLPVQLVDTAGIRPTHDEVERLGIERTWQAVAEADLILHVLDATAPAELGVATAAFTSSAAPVLTVLNKADLLQPATREHLNRVLPTQQQAGISGSILTSTVTGEGLGQLTDAITAALGSASIDTTAAALTNTRQHAAAQQAVQALRAAQSATRRQVPHEAVLIDLYATLQALDALTGQTLPDHILATIFSTFCIGK